MTGNSYFIFGLLFIEVSNRHIPLSPCCQNTSSVISSIFISREEKEKEVKFIEHAINYCLPFCFDASK